MSHQDHSVLLPTCQLLASPALPLEPWTAPILVMIAAATGVKRPSLVSPTQPLGTESGKRDQFALLVAAVAPRVSSGDAN